MAHPSVLAGGIGLRHGLGISSRRQLGCVGHGPSVGGHSRLGVGDGHELSIQSHWQLGQAGIVPQVGVFWFTGGLPLERAILEPFTIASCQLGGNLEARPYDGTWGLKAIQGTQQATGGQPNPRLPQPHFIACQGSDEPPIGQICPQAPLSSRCNRHHCPFQPQPHTPSPGNRRGCPQEALVSRSHQQAGTMM